MAFNASNSGVVQQHIDVLDGVRGIAILLVIWVHFAQLFPEQMKTSTGKLALAGQTGVDLFFVLSGFLITGILLDAKGSRHSLLNFFVRRTLRIMPLYYAALISLYWIAPALHLAGWVPWGQSIWYWVYLQDVPQCFAPGLQTGPNHFWTLAVEQHFYLLCPFLVVVFSRKKLVAAFLAIILVSLLSRVVWSQYETYYFTLARLDGLSLGALLAILARRHIQRDEADVFRRTTLCAWGVLNVALVALVVGTVLPPALLPVVRVSRNTLVGLIYAASLLLVLENQRGPVGRILASKPLRSVGRYSYAMYIFHPFLFAFLRARGWMTYRPLSLALGLAVTYVAGWISWQILEMPVLRLKRYFEFERQPGEIRYFKVTGTG